MSNNLTTNHWRALKELSEGPVRVQSITNDDDAYKWRDLVTLNEQGLCFKSIQHEDVSFHINHNGLDMLAEFGDKVKMI